MTLIASSGSWIVIAVFVLALVGVAVGIFSRSGSGIEDHPLGGDRTDGAPGAEGPSEVSGRDGGDTSAFDQHGKQ